MMSESLIAAVKDQPFKPFVVQMNDGQEFPVPSPEFIFIPPKSRTVVIYNGDGGFHLVDILHISSLAYDAPNRGRRRRRAG